MHDAFISYRRAPSYPTAQLIQTTLRTDHGIDAYLDVTRADGARVYDMSGNVWESTSSLYEGYPYSATDGREADTGIGIDVRRVLRGGSWFNSASGLRAVHEPPLRRRGVGRGASRCARSVCVASGSR